MHISSIERLLSARHHDPFAILGLHSDHGKPVLRVLRPHAESVTLLLPEGEAALTRADVRGLFEWHGTQAPAKPVRLRIREDGRDFEIVDPYAFV